ncbi:MAG: methyltransferase domain-containing protein [Dehalococcoidales bacterium]|nr:methyltransferase domain-containing protein [Dehalococcoidales bacterium]
MVNETQLFDEWPERYDQWFLTPIGKLIKEIEGKCKNDLLDPRPGEKILDAGCGTGIFTLDFLTKGPNIVGLDISNQMLKCAVKKTADYPFFKIQGDMLSLPFMDDSFDKSVSITALEFIADAKSAIDELFRVTRPGGYVVITTLNSLSPWATRRKVKTQEGLKHILENAFFRSPHQLLTYS